MNEEKIREKYPNIKTEEEFDKLCKMLRYKNNEKVAILCACALLVLGAILYGLNLIIAIICMIAASVVWVIGVARWGRYIDNYFLATASRKKAENRFVLNQEILQKTLKKDIVKQLWSDFIASELIGLLCMIVWGFVLMFLGEEDAEIPVLVFFAMIPLVAFGILKIGAIIKIRKTKNTPYILLHTKVVDRKSISSSDPESSSENYYFTFNCADYGMLDCEVESSRYYSAFVGKDEYYLVIVKKRFSKKHRIAEIFSIEEYELSPELKRIVVVI